MAVIAFNGNTLNCTLGMGTFENIGNAFTNAKNSANGLSDALKSLRTKIDIASVASNVSTSQEQVGQAVNRETEKQSTLSLAYDKLDTLVSNVGVVDDKAASKIHQRKNDFYDRYSYLKPDCEKSDKELKAERRAEKWENFKNWCSGVVESAKNLIKSVGEWCKEHWKAIATALILVVAVVGLVLLSAIPGGGIVAAIIAGACWGAIAGAVIGGVSGGIASKKNGGSFWEGFENGAFSGAISGAIGGAITGGATATLGPISSLMSGILRGAGTGAVSTGISNMTITAIDYYATNGTLDGSANQIITSGISGAISGGIFGGVMGGIQFKVVDSIHSYTTNECYGNINNSLRGFDTLDDANVSIVKNIHMKLQGASLSEDMTLYRGTDTQILRQINGMPSDLTSLKYLPADQLQEKLVGNILTENAFQSVSTDYSVAYGFSKDMVMIIDAPKGSHGIDVASISASPWESEILFDYGQKMMITGAEYVNNLLKLNVTFIP